MKIEEKNKVNALKKCGIRKRKEKANTESLTQSLNDVRKQIEEINAQNGANITDEKQLDLLEKEEASLTRQLAIQKQKEESARRELAESAKGVATGQVQVTGEYRKAIGQDADMMVQTTVAVERATKALGLMIRRKQLVQLLLLLMAQAKADKIS